MGRVTHKTDQEKEPKPERYEPSITQTRKDALKAAKDLRYPTRVITALKEAKTEAEIYHIMHKQREKL